jgi:hypothetical protein
MMKITRTFMGLMAFLCLFPALTYAQIAGQNPVLFTHKNNGYTLGVGMNAVEEGDYTGRLNFRGWVDDQYYHSGIEIASQVTGPVMDNGFPANLTFATGYPDLQTRILITADGLVGVGTETPVFHLDISGDTHTSGDFFGRLHVDDNGSSDAAPDTYIDEVYFERHSVDGFTTKPESIAAEGGIMSLAPGGTAYDHQLFFAEDGIFHRSETANNGDWTNAWSRLLNSSDISGTENRIAKFTGANTLDDSQLFDDGSQVGIRTTTPAAGFDVEIEGDTRNTGDLDVTGTGHFSGKVAIGTTNTLGSHSLYVGGSMIAEEILVKLQGSWPDYVFSETYRLLPLEAVEAHIRENGRLHGTAPATDIEANGLTLGENMVNQQEKIEELFLHLIEMNKQMKAMQEENTRLQARLDQLEN